ncbi:hypothetical protein PHISCL_03895 [Aspergillus sclerotialis]|uniref:Uncharacterized protein n=1 Tax=Aspergillus sclerotialis TaxID=2070753 RepID=A0A3A3A0U2_9EURO|nr:hypothetical protein PHISCL_03895 [Aspergillus sclerotialis]
MHFDKESAAARGNEIVAETNPEPANTVEALGTRVSESEIVEQPELDRYGKPTKRIKCSETSASAQLQKRVISLDMANMVHPANSLSAHVLTEKKMEGLKVVTEKKKTLEKMVRELLNIKDPKFDITQFFLSIDTSACFTNHKVNSFFNPPHVETVVNLLIRNYRAGGYKGNEILIATPEAAQCTRYEREFRVLDHLPIEYRPIVGMLDKIMETKARVLIFDVTKAAPRRQAHHIIYDMLEVSNLKTFDVRVDVCRLSSKLIAITPRTYTGRLPKQIPKRRPRDPAFGGLRTGFGV